MDTKTIKLVATISLLKVLAQNDFPKRAASNSAPCGYTKWFCKEKKKVDLTTIFLAHKSETTTSVYKDNLPYQNIQ